MNNPIITLIYSHGRYGSPWYGFKIEALRGVALGAGCNVLSIRYPEEMPVAEMEEQLFQLACNEVNVPGDLVFLSSSRGAYISTRVAAAVIKRFEVEPDRIDEDKALPRRHVLGQFLIAPAFYIKPEYYPDQNPTPPDVMKTAIVHGLQDDVINCENSIRFARSFGAELHLVSGGHRLNSQREKLCMLFREFLGARVREAESLFVEWLAKHPQRDAESDDMAPNVKR